MGAKAFFAKGWPTRLAFYLGKFFPPRAGNFMASAAARMLVTLKLDVYHVAKVNLRHVVGEDATEEELHQMTYRLFRQAACSYYELFHNIGSGRVDVTQFKPPVRLSSEAELYLTEALASGRGVFIAACHMANFDLAGLALGQLMPVPLQVLSLAAPEPGFEVFNQLREEGGALLTPISPASLRSAMRRLKDGGAVITGVDRPIGAGDELVEFFGAPARMPFGYIRIPLRTDCLVITATARYEAGEYQIIANPPLEMSHTGDRVRDQQVNVQRILAQFETFIRQRPDQWMMFVPVWVGEQAGYPPNLGSSRN